MRWSDRTGTRLKLRDLHVLLVVVEQGSMSAAANRLAVSVPVVSKTISDLERLLGVKLLDRGARGVTLTIYGSALLESGVAVFDDLQRGLRQIEHLLDPTCGEVSIGAAEPLMAGVVAAVINRLSGKYPKVVFHAAQGDIATLHRLLRSRKVDLVLARRPAEGVEEDLTTEMLFDEHLSIVAGHLNRWARKRKIALQELIEEPWILPPPETAFGQAVEQIFNAVDLPLPKARVVTLSLPLRNSLLATGRFITVVADSMLDTSMQKFPVCVLPVRLPVRPHPVEIVYLKNRTLVPAARLFIECARSIRNPNAKSSSEGRTYKAGLR